MAKWKDITSYSQGDKERVPRVWKIHFGDFELTVHRHIYYDPKMWLASSPLFERREMGEDLEEAKKKAIELLKSKLTTAIKEMEDVG